MGKAILIVEDDPLSLKLTRDLLNVSGYTTIQADDGKMGVEKAKSDKPDLILMDIMMPGMNGFETTERLKSNPPTRDIPIIVVTSLDDRESRLYALQAGADEFLSKPVDRAELSVRVKNLLALKECRRLMEQQGVAADKGSLAEG